MDSECGQFREAHLEKLIRYLSAHFPEETDQVLATYQLHLTELLVPPSLEPYNSCLPADSSALHSFHHDQRRLASITLVARQVLAQVPSTC